MRPYIFFNIFFILIAITLVGCGEGFSPLERRETQNQPALPSPEPEDRNHSGEEIAPITDEQALCYPGKLNSPSCYEITKAEDLEDPHGNFLYKLPTSANGFPTSLNAQFYQPPLFFLDLLVIYPLDWLSDHFRFKEWLPSGKGRYGYISPQIVATIQELRDLIDKPLIINSSYRSPAYNATLSGAATWSRHQYGDAIDFKAGTTSLEDLAQFCVSLGASFFQIYQSHVHCDWRYGFGDITPHTSRLQKYLAEQVEVHIDHKKNTIEVVSAYQEDPGELQVIWLPAKGSKTRPHFGSKVSLPDVNKIHLHVGGSLSLLIDINKK